MATIGTKNYANNGGVIGPDNDPTQLPEVITSYTSPATWTPSGPAVAEVIIVGAGGGGGGNRGAGGGAGAVLHSTSYTVPGSPVSVSIGGGGGPSNNIPPGSPGGSTSFDGVSAPGGGGGGGHMGGFAGLTGGSGGGSGLNMGAYNAPSNAAPVTVPGGSFTGYGNPGGPAGDPAGGGGGAGSAGDRPPGGAGIGLDITSPTASPVISYYASGGVGGNNSSQNPPASAGGGSSPTPDRRNGGGGGSHGPARDSNGSGQNGYVAIKEPGSFGGAPGIWRLNEVYELVKAGNWSS